MASDIAKMDSNGRYFLTVTKAKRNLMIAGKQANYTPVKPEPARLLDIQAGATGTENYLG